MTDPERLGCKLRKAQRLAEKAWASVEPIPQKVLEEKRLHYPNRTLRFMMGIVWVFAVDPDGTVELVTLMHVTKYADRKERMVR